MPTKADAILELLKQLCSTPEEAVELLDAVKNLIQRGEGNG